MSLNVYLIGALVVATAVYPAAWLLVHTYRRYRGTHVVTCPETKKSVAVELDAGQAAFSALLGHPEVRVTSCTHWPERQDCGQKCLEQIEKAPEACLLRGVLLRWYEGKRCFYCGKPFDSLDSFALKTPAGVTVDWREIPAEKIPEILWTNQPVCWDCHVEQVFKQACSQFEVVAGR